MTSSTPSVYTENYFTQLGFSLQGEPTSPTWRPCSPSSIMVLSYHTPLHGIMQSIYGGGRANSLTPTYPDPSENPAAPPNTMPTLMPAQDSGSQSRSGADGARGVSLPDGGPRAGTYNGRRPSASSSSSLCPVCSIKQGRAYHGLWGQPRGRQGMVEALKCQQAHQPSLPPHSQAVGESR